MKVWVVVVALPAGRDVVVGVFAQEPEANRLLAEKSSRRVIGPIEVVGLDAEAKGTDEPETAQPTGWFGALAKLATDSPDEDLRRAAAEELLRPLVFYSTGLVDPDDLHRAGLRPVPVHAGKPGEVVAVGGMAARAANPPDG